MNQSNKQSISQSNNQSLHIAIIGASGFIGTALTREALGRGFKVRALVSRPQPMEAAANLEIVGVDVMDTQALTQAIAGVDVVISAFSGHAATDVAGYYLQGFASILDAVKDQTVAPRLLLVGGAASLQLPDGSLLLDSPNFPNEYRATAQGAYTALQILRAQTELSWAYLSPAAVIFPGGQTGQFRLGGDQLLMDANGDSRISTGGYAVALLDEVQQPQQHNRRFSVAY